MRTYRNVLAVLFVIAYMAVLSYVLTGCTIYKVHSVPGQSAKVSIYSTRSFDAPELSYQRTGQDATFIFGADAASQPGPGDYTQGIIDGVTTYLGNYCEPFTQ